MKWFDLALSAAGAWLFAGAGWGAGVVNHSGGAAINRFFCFGCTIMSATRCFSAASCSAAFARQRSAVACDLAPIAGSSAWGALGSNGRIVSTILPCLLLDETPARDRGLPIGGQYSALPCSQSRCRQALVPVGAGGYYTTCHYFFSYRIIRVIAY